jgi:UDP-glucose 4-epimerase
LKGNVLNKTCLVTGGKGFIGSRLVKTLKNKGYDVLVADKVPNECWTGDIEDVKFLDFFTEQDIDYIFHFGAPCSVLQFNENPEYCVQNTVKSFQNVVWLAKVSKAKLIYPSSGNVYGNLEPPYKESMTPHPNNLYGVCKYICEGLAGTNSVGLRIFTGYGPGEEKKGKLSSVVYQFLWDVMNERAPVFWGNGFQMRDCVHIDDIVDIAVGCMNKITPPILNVGTGVPVTYLEIVNTAEFVCETSVVKKVKEKPKNYVDTAVADITLLKEVFPEYNPKKLLEGIRGFKEYLWTQNKELKR